MLQLAADTLIILLLFIKYLNKSIYVFYDTNFQRINISISEKANQFIL